MPSNRKILSQLQFSRDDREESSFLSRLYLSSISWAHRLLIILRTPRFWTYLALKDLLPSDRCRNVSSPTDWFLHIIFAPWFKACPCFVSVVGWIRGCQGKKPRLAGFSAATLTFSLVLCGRVLLASPLPASDWWTVPLLISMLTLTAHFLICQWWMNAPPVDMTCTVCSPQEPTALISNSQNCLKLRNTLNTKGSLGKHQRILPWKSPFSF